MKNVNQIIKHPLYIKSLEMIEKAEQDRVYCKHDMEHFLAVARIAYIYNVEAGEGLPRNRIYAAALLHDIGRGIEYEKGIPHHEASAEIAGKILPECGFSQRDQDAIMDAILFHREKTGESQNRLRSFLYKADKFSRNCFACKAQETCDWRKEKRNMEIDY